MTYLLNEVTSDQKAYEILKEEGSLKNNTYCVHFKTALQTFDEKNSNGRIYTMESGKEIYQQCKTLIKESKFIGELDHPISSKAERESSVELKFVSHMFTDIRLEDNTLYGKGKTLSTQYGQTLSALLKDGIKVGFSLRALGFNVKKNMEKSAEVVNPPVIVISYDCVARPSHKEAVVLEVSVKEALNYALRCQNGICTLIQKDTILQEHVLPYFESSDSVLDYLIEQKLTPGALCIKKFLMDKKRRRVKFSIY